MKSHLQSFVKKRFKVSLDDLPEPEHRIVQHFREPPAYLLTASHPRNLRAEVLQ